MQALEDLNKFINSHFCNTVLPFERSYWVIPGKLLAGNLPYNENHEVGVKNLCNLLHLGIRTFINLMHNDEVNFDGSILPCYKEILNELAHKHKVNINFYRKPIKDFSIPDVSQMVEILNIIDQSIYNNMPVYVHCWGGKGRTGTVVGCYLIRHQMASVSNVIETIAYLRRTDPKKEFNSPETIEQINFVKSWNIMQ